MLELSDEMLIEILTNINLNIKSGDKSTWYNKKTDKRFDLHHMRIVCKKFQSVINMHSFWQVSEI
jgi:hypothetical protein